MFDTKRRVILISVPAWYMSMFLYMVQIGDERLRQVPFDARQEQMYHNGDKQKTTTTCTNKYTLP